MIIKKYFTIFLLFSIYDISIIEKFFIIIKTLWLWREVYDDEEILYNISIVFYL